MGFFTSREESKKKERRIENLEYDLKTKKHELSRIHKRYEKELQEQEDEYEKKLYKAEKGVERARRDTEEAEAERNALQDKLDGQYDVAAKEIALREKEKMLDAREQALGGTDKVLEDLTNKAQASKDEGYKNGYADGVSDGLRKGSDLAADERKMAMQIAAISAASHVPEATTKIANDMVKEATRALSAGKTKTTK